MEIFESRAYYYLLDRFTSEMRLCEEQKKAGEAKPTEGFLSEVKQVMKEAEEFCRNAEFTAATSKIVLINVHFESYLDGLDYSGLLSEIRNAEEIMFSDFWNRKFIAVPIRFTDFINNNALFGPEVSAAFGSAAEDIREAGNCIAVDLGTAAVFHLMRSVEWGLRALCVHLRVTKIPKSRKPGKRSKVIPLEYSQWEKILTELQEAIDKKTGNMAPGSRKQKDQEFYYPLLGEIGSFKDAWRNHVMHSRVKYTGQDAEAIMDHVKRFFVTLSTRVSE